MFYADNSVIYIHVEESSYWGIRISSVRSYEHGVLFQQHSENPFYSFDSLRILLQAKPITIWLPSIMMNLKLFRTVQKYFVALGFYAPSQPNHICSFNRKNGFHFCTVTGMCISLAGFFCLKANSAYEYSISFYMLISVMAITVHFTVFLQKMGSIAKLIENYQEFIKKRKWPP